MQPLPVGLPVKVSAVARWTFGSRFLLSEGYNIRPILNQRNFDDLNEYVLYWCRMDLKVIPRWIMNCVENNSFRCKDSWMYA